MEVTLPARVETISHGKKSEILCALHHYHKDITRCGRIHCILTLATRRKVISAVGLKDIDLHNNKQNGHRMLTKGGKRLLFFSSISSYVQSIPMVYMGLQYIHVPCYKGTLIIESIDIPIGRGRKSRG